MRVIVDMSGFNMDHLYMPTIKVYISLLKLMQVPIASATSEV